MNLSVVLLGLVIIVYGLAGGYVMGITFYPEGCCEDLGSYLILAHMFAFPISGIFVMLKFGWK